MSVTVFLHLNETKNDDFDLDKFDREMEKKYPETSKEISNSELFSYDICWENYSNFYQFTLISIVCGGFYVSRRRLS